MYLCYGDDSINNDIIAYAIIGIKNDRVDKFINDYNELKKNYNLEKDTVLHCRELFHSSKRSKNYQLSKLTYDEVSQMCIEIIDLCCDHELPRPILAYDLKKKYPNKFKRKQKFEDASMDEMQGLHLMKNTCLKTLYDQLGKNEENYRFFADKVSPKDRISKKAMAIGGRRKRNALPNFLLPPVMTNEAKHIRLREKKYEEAVFKEMYEVADLLAYSSTKALCTQLFQDKQYFKDLLFKMNPIFVRFGDK